MAVEHTQLTYVSNSERSPTKRRSARAFTTDLIHKKGLGTLSNSVVVGFDDTWSPALVDEFDEPLAPNREY